MTRHLSSVAGAATLICLSVLLNGCGGGGEGSDGDPEPRTTSGLDSRPRNLACVAPARVVATELGLSRAYSGLSFQQPLLALQAPGDPDHWYVVEKPGRIYRFDATDESTSARSLVIDMRSVVNDASEGGLLGMAFHPGFPTVNEVYLSYTAGSTSQGSFESRIARYTTSVQPQGGIVLNAGSGSVILRVPQPYGNHNGGHIAFGPDGYLYIGLGDGGSGGDPLDHGQRLDTLLGAMLRIDVDAGATYAIPADNPFAAGGGRPEIFAYGLRNPWRWSFDRATGALWAGDVGQGSREEINVIERGKNYGWRCYEGTRPYDTRGCGAQDSYQAPVAEYGRGEGRSVTGGYVYRGTRLAGLGGVYVYGDYGSGRIWGLHPDGTGGYDNRLLIESGRNIASFGEALDGELLAIDIGGGGLYRLVASGPAGSGVAAQLSRTGCVDPSRPQLPADGVIPYTVGPQLWSDGAEKERFLAIPDGSRIGLADDGDLLLPIGAVTMKHFRLGDRLVETRLFMRHPDGDWAGYSYQWNASQTDATLVDGAKAVDWNGETWHHPDAADCLQCHTEAAGFSLGPELRQLDRSMVYPATGRAANQVDTLAHIGLLPERIDAALREAPLPATQDASASIAERARAYLHANCSGCHRPGAPGRGDLDLRDDTSLAQTMACDVTPSFGDMGLADARIVAPGDPARSVLLARMRALDGLRMPPLASYVVDRDGAALVEQWIAGLAECD